MAETTVTAKVLADTSGFMAGLNRAGKSMNKFGQQAVQVGRNLSTSISLPIILVGRAAIKTAASFEFAQKKIEALRGGASIKDLTKSARDLGASTIFTAEQVSQLQLSLAKLGKSNNEIQAIQGTVLKFAQAMDQDLAPAGEFLVKTMNRYADSLVNVGNKTEQAAYVANLFAAVAANTALDSEKLANALNYVGSEAAAYGITLGETSAILGLLADRGFDASRGGTALRRVLGQLAKEGYSAKEAIRALLDGTNGYADALAQFGLRGAGPAAALGGLNDEFEKLLNTIEGSQGFLDQFSTVLDTSMEASLKRVSSAATEVSLSFSEEFAPAINNVLNNITKLLNAFSDLPKFLKVVIVSLGAFLAIAGPLVLIVGALASAIGVLAAATVTVATVVTGAIVVFAAIAAAIALIYYEADLATVSLDELKRAASEAGGEAKAMASNPFVTKEELVKLTKLQKALNDVRQDQKDLASSWRPSSMLMRSETIDYDSVYEKHAKNIKKQIDSEVFAIRKLNEERRLAAESAKNFARDSGNLFSYFIPGQRNGSSAEDQVAGETTLNEVLKKRVKILNDLKDIREESKKSGVVLDIQLVNDLESQLKDLEEVLKSFGINIKDLDATKGLLDVPKKLKAISSASKELKEALGETDKFNVKGSIVSRVFGKADLKSLLGAEDGLATKKLNAFLDVAMLSAEAMHELQEGTNLTTKAVQKLVTEMDRDKLLRNFEELYGVAFSIAGTFESAFSTALDGTMSLGEAIKTTLGDAIKSLIAKLAGLAAAWGVVALLATIATGGGNLSVAAKNIAGSGFAGFSSFMLGGMGLDSFSKSAQAGSRSYQQGVLSGNDIALSTRRGVTANQRIYG